MVLYIYISTQKNSLQNFFFAEHYEGESKGRCLREFLKLRKEKFSIF
jgi:hypothetical protein